MGPTGLCGIWLSILSRPFTVRDGYCKWAAFLPANVARNVEQCIRLSDTVWQCAPDGMIQSERYRFLEQSY